MPHLPTRKQCLELLRKYDAPEHMVEHSLAVEKVAVFLAEKMRAAGKKIDVDLVSRAALLHDIGKPESLRTGVSHGERGKEILLAEGMPAAVAGTAKSHALYIICAKKPFRGWEEKIVFYADKRVNHTEIVSLEERFKYLIGRYGNTKEKAERIGACREKVLELEKEILRKAKCDKSLCGLK
ncbi:MAG: HDIG domain-containing protein [Candidatus Diapherotrites archaeon]|nr:HDIG domain-containing protein [Candidatus Diapherotrites archaeon]